LADINKDIGFPQNVQKNETISYFGTEFIILVQYGLVILATILTREHDVLDLIEVYTIEYDMPAVAALVVGQAPALHHRPTSGLLRSSLLPLKHGSRSLLRFRNDPHLELYSVTQGYITLL
jgi:hypothetical protein